MAKTESFVSVVDFEARNAKLLRVLKQNREGMRRNAKALKDLKQGYKRTEKDVRATRKAIGAFGSTARSAVPLITGLIAAMGVDKIRQAADSWTLLTNRVRLFTDTAYEGELLQKGLFKTAQKTRTNLSGTAEVYQRLAQANKELNLSQEALVSLLTTINKTIQISGVETVSAKAALIQFGQALASAQLRGQELNSVMEQAPRLAQAIADGLGIPISQMRKWAFEGKITSKTIVAALQSQAAVIDEEFGRIEKTTDAAMTVAVNSLTRIIGKLNESLGVTRRLTDAVVKLAEQFDEIAESESGIAKWANHLKSFEVRARQSVATVGALENLVKKIGKGIGDWHRETHQMMLNLQDDITPDFASNFSKKAGEAFSENFKESFLGVFKFIERGADRIFGGAISDWRRELAALQTELDVFADGPVGPKDMRRKKPFVMPSGASGLLAGYEKELDKAGRDFMRNFREELYSGDFEKELAKHSPFHPLFAIPEQTKKDLKNDLKQADADLEKYLDKWEQGIDAELYKQFYEMGKGLADLSPHLKEISETGKMFGSTMTDAFTEMVRSIGDAERSMGQTIKRMLQQITDLIFEITVLRHVRTDIARWFDNAFPSLAQVATDGAPTAPAPKIVAAGKRAMSAAHQAMPAGKPTAPVDPSQVPNSELGNGQSINIESVTLKIEWVGDPKMITEDDLPDIYGAIESKLTERVQRPTTPIGAAIEKRRR